MGKSFKELHQDVLETSRAAKQAVEEAGELVGNAREKRPETVSPLDEALNRAHGAYLKSVEALAEFKDTVNLLKKSKSFMAEAINREVLEGSEKLADMATGVNQGIKSTLQLLEESLMIVKEDMGVKDEVPLECDSRSKGKKQPKQNKCAPGCIIL